MNINNLETPLERLSDGIGIGSSANRTDIRPCDRAVVDRIDCLPVSENTVGTGLVTIQFDDGYDNVYTVAKPVLDAAGVVGSVPIITSLVGNTGRLTWEQIISLYESGWEIVNHSHSHVDYTTLTAEQVDTDLLTSNNLFAANGIRPKAFVFPGNQSNSTLRLAVAKYHSLIRAVAPSSVFKNSYQTSPSFLACMSSEIYTQAQVETVLSSIATAGGWLILYQHSIDTAKATELESLLATCATLGLNVVTMEDAASRIGYRFVAGNGGGAHTSGGALIRDNGDASFHHVDIHEQIKIRDLAYPDQYAYIKLHGYGDLYIAPNTVSRSVAFMDCLDIYPRRSTGSSRRVVDVGRTGFEFRYFYGIGIGSTYGDFCVQSEDAIRFYAGATQDSAISNHTGINALTLREDGVTEMIVADFVQLSTAPSKPAEGHSILWTDDSGDLYAASTVDSVTRKTKIGDYASGEVVA